MSVDDVVTDRTHWAFSLETMVWVIEFVDEVRELRERSHGLDAGRFAGVSGAELCPVALEVRRARELLDRLEVHALGELAGLGHTELTCGMTTAVHLSGGRPGRSDGCKV